METFLKGKKPYIIEFKRIGEMATGYISVAEIEEQIPFKIERVFWTYYTPESIMRGTHAHHNTQQVLIAVAGTITLHTELPDGTKDKFLLDSPDKGVYLPPYAWHEMHYSHNAVQLVLASTKYAKEDYIRDYEQFKKLKDHG